jgi:RecB family exonuclease
MNRTIYVHTYPLAEAKKLASDRQISVMTPTPQAARSLSIPHFSLENLAKQIIRKHQFSEVPLLTAHRYLRKTVSEVLSTTDVEGTTRKVAPILKELLKIGDWQSIGKLTPASVPRRFQPLVDLAEAYQQRLREKKLLDSAEILWFASQLNPMRQSLLVYGYDFPLMDQLQFVDAVAGDRSVWFLPVVNHPLFSENQKAIAWLQERGWQIKHDEIDEIDEIDQEVAATANHQNPNHPGKYLSQKFLGLSDEPPEPKESNPAKVYAYPHLEAEVRGILALVKEQLLQKVPSNQIAIVARDEKIYGPMILDIAWEYDLPIRALYSIPLTATRLGNWIETLGQVAIADLPFEQTAKLLTHPLCSGLPPECWVRARKMHPSGLKKWQEILQPKGDEKVSTSQAVDLSVDLSILSWPSQDTRENWVERLQNVFKAFNLRKRAARWAREAVAYYQFQEGLVYLSKPEREILTIEEFIQEISQLMALLMVPAAPGRGGVELHTPASLVGTEYQSVFVLGMAEGMLPAPVVDSPVLDFRDRQLLRKSGIPLANAVETAQREALNFYGCLKTASQNLIFSYPQTQGSTPMLPSPYIKRLDLELEAAPPLPVASVQLSRQVELGAIAVAAVGDLQSIGVSQNAPEADPILNHAYHCWAVEKRRESRQPPDEYDGAISIGLDPNEWEFSASQLTNLGQCAFKWFSQKQLHLLDLEEAEEELSTSLRGRLYHKTLELAVESAAAAGGENFVATAIEQLETAFSQAEKAENLENLPPLPGWQARRQEHLTVLQRAVSAADFLQENTEILATEKKFTGTWYGLKVKGTLDRIDRTPEGLAIVDYKTSSTAPKGAKDANGQAKLDIQLPLYVQVAAKDLFPGQPVTNAYYYSLTKGKILKEVAIDETALAEFAENVKRRLQQGHYPVDPDHKREACQYCDYDLVCRQGSRLSRK